MKGSLLVQFFSGHFCMIYFFLQACVGVFQYTGIELFTVVDVVQYRTESLSENNFKEAWRRAVCSFVKSNNPLKTKWLFSGHFHTCLKMTTLQWPQCGQEPSGPHSATQIRSPCITDHMNYIILYYMIVQGTIYFNFINFGFLQDNDKFLKTGINSCSGSQ